MTHHLVKTAFRSFAARAYWASPHFFGLVRGKVLIVTYHRVIPGNDLDATFVQPGMYVTPATFERHLQFFAEYFRMVSFEQLLEAWDGRSLDPGARYCAITFDDGWLDNYRYAFPLLRAYRVPATIFLPTALIGTSRWLWSDRLGYLLRHHCLQGRLDAVREALAPLARLHPELRVAGRRPDEEAFDSVIEAAKTVPASDREQLLASLEQSGSEVPCERCFITWDEAREMSAHGIAFGSHTCTHPALTCVEGEQRQRELRESRDVLRQQGLDEVPVLAYPYGDHTDDVVEDARAAGYRAAVTTGPGLESGRPTDPFRLKRIGIHDDVSRSIPLLMFHIARQANATPGVAS